MTLAEANAVAVEMHSGVLKPISGMTGAFLFGTAGNLSFCGDTLFAINFNISGGLEAYASLAEDMLRQYGQPIFFANQEFTDSGSLAYVRTTWQDDSGDDLDLSLTTYAGGQTVAARSLSSHHRLCPQ